MGRRAPGLAMALDHADQGHQPNAGPEVGAHRARGDARMTLGVLCYLQRRTNGRKSTNWSIFRL